MQTNLGKPALAPAHEGQTPISAAEHRAAERAELLKYVIEHGTYEPIPLRGRDRSVLCDGMYSLLLDERSARGWFGWTLKQFRHVINGLERVAVDWHGKSCCWLFYWPEQGPKAAAEGGQR
jgi:hypothetical protein